MNEPTITAHRVTGTQPDWQGKPYEVAYTRFDVSATIGQAGVIEAQGLPWGAAYNLLRDVLGIHGRRVTTLLDTAASLVAVAS
jgi:hypothetical protein